MFSLMFKVQGTPYEAKGKVKEKIGQGTDNPKLEDKGADEKVAGKIQKKIGDVEKCSKSNSLKAEEARNYFRRLRL